MTMTNSLTSIHRIWWLVLSLLALPLGGCERSEPSSTVIKDYIENYQIVHDLKVASMSYETEPEKGDQFGSIQVSGQLELRESLYVEDEGNRRFRKNVAKMLRRNRFSEREINHDIYDRIVRASARLPDEENEYYSFLNVEHEPGLAINFSANLIYKTGNDGFVIDGPVRHAKLLGSRITKFSNPVLDDAELVQKAVENVLTEQTRYRELMKESRALLSRLWNNDFGVVVWNRKVPYLGSENLSDDEQAQLTEFQEWRGVYHISNIKPVQYRTAHASNFFELGSYNTEGIATCLRQTGFVDQLTFLKSQFDQYCEFGKQYPVRVKLGSNLDETNQFVATVQFEVNGIDSGELYHDSKQFKREQNELARYSDQQHLSVLNKRFDIKHHSRPNFSTVGIESTGPERLSLRYVGASNYSLANFDNDGAGENEIVGTLETPQQQETPLPLDVSKEFDDTIEPSDVVDAEVENDDGVDANTMTQKELVKAIQIELKRLGAYHSGIDGVAGDGTYRSMKHVRHQLGREEFKQPSVEFLTLLRDTPISAIEPVAVPQAVVANQQTPADEKLVVQKKKKGTLAGKALKGTGRAIDNATRWVGKQFGKKKKD